MSEFLYLSDADVRACGVEMDQIIDVLHEAYRFKGLGRVEMPPKPGVHPRPDCHLHAMPAYIEDLGAVGIKWVGAYPSNVVQGLPQISGLIVLNDPDTGLPQCMMDCRWVTAKRTGAKTAVAARYLARPESSSVGIVGCGVQGRSNLEALACRFDVATVHAYDVNREAAERFAAEMGCRRFGVRVMDSAEAAVREMDIVVTSGPIRRKPEPVVVASWLKPGSFSAPVDFDSYFTGAAMQAMDLFVTDDAAQFEYYRSLGFCRQAPEAARVIDLGRIVSDMTIQAGNMLTTDDPELLKLYHSLGYSQESAGTSRALDPDKARFASALHRKDDRQRTMAMNLGSGMDDVAVAPLVFRAAQRKGLGTRLEL